MFDVSGVEIAHRLVDVLVVMDGAWQLGTLHLARVAVAVPLSRK